MNDLLKKLNVLVKSTLHEALHDEPGQKPLASPKLSKGLDREVEELRQRINEALSFEDQLQARVQSLQAEIDKWDEQADEAVQGNNDANARYAIEQMQRTQQRLTIAQSDLREHQLVTQELITRVNTMDAAVADAQRSQSQTPENSEQIAPLQDDQAVPASLPQDEDEGDADHDSPQVNIIGQVPAPAAPQVEDQTVEDDLARRRQRLSKPG